ncbi:MAG: hypothetical protein L0220_28590 [Acidobacteria bacterium]|nr:hypothetical protein [Acidobacteriota bacterium]
MIAQAERFRSKENIWLVALYEQEARADELLDRLSAIGIDTSEATTLRVDLDDRLRAAKITPRSDLSPLSPAARNAVSGALIGGVFSLLSGIILYASEILKLRIVEGLFNHSVLFVTCGATLGALVGVIFALLRKTRDKDRALEMTMIPGIEQVKSDGFLVAVKMPPPLAGQAEEIARGLGAKEILL